MFPMREEVIKGINHPHIASMYLKRDFSDMESPEDVLVIETVEHNTHDLEMYGRDEYILDLLLDLQGLKSQVERQVGKFSRVDIRCH
ncbi:MAG: hypothetical protein KKA05_00150 [Alphaproteobacteria bacterium]|nr:hypothetical protein [Alphaproteobacteria bacterium]MBU0859378.1 hypothetical protein [Alphaproteobacteria bacterium]